VSALEILAADLAHRPCPLTRGLHHSHQYKLNRMGICWRPTHFTHRCTHLVALVSLARPVVITIIISQIDRFLLALACLLKQSRDVTAVQRT